MNCGSVFSSAPRSRGDGRIVRTTTRTGPLGVEREQAVRTRTSIIRKTNRKGSEYMAKSTAVKEPMTKAQLLSAIAEETGLTRKQVADVMDSLGGQIRRHVKQRGPGAFTLPGLLKIKTVRKPARKARKGINPFTGEETTFAAKSAHTAVKIQPLKGLKDMVA